MRIYVALLFCLLSSGSLAAQERCHAEIPCALDGRSYHVKEPDGWDGVTPLPVLLHFHGWGRQGSLIVQHQRISGATRRRGVLLVAPNGLRRTWDFWRSGSADVTFARAVLDDIVARYPVDRRQIYVSGYSWGANMAWRFVCDDGGDVAALLAISGGLEQDADCAQAPRAMRQVYGLADSVLPYPEGPGGDLDHPVGLWRERMGCGTGRDAGTWNAVSFLTLTRRVWDGCAVGPVVLDRHPGGHFIPHGWIARQLDEIMGRAPTYP